MFRRRRYEEPPGLQEFMQQTAHLMDPTSPELARRIQETLAETAPASPAVDAGEDFLPPALRAPDSRELAGG